MYGDPSCGSSFRNRRWRRLLVGMKMSTCRNLGRGIISLRAGSGSRPVYFPLECESVQSIAVASSNGAGESAWSSKFELPSIILVDIMRSVEIWFVGWTAGQDEHFELELDINGDIARTKCFTDGPRPRRSTGSRLLPSSRKQGLDQIKTLVYSVKQPPKRKKVYSSHEASPQLQYATLSRCLAASSPRATSS